MIATATLEPSAGLHPVAASPSPEPLTVLVADDHPLFRRGVARAIGRHPGLELVAEATDGREALALIAAMRPDVAVLDHRMPGLSGVEVSAQLRLHPESSPTAILLLSAFEDDEIVAAAIGAGASGYLGKTASPAEICAAVERVGRGGTAFSAAVPADPTQPLPPGLRPRQRPA
jgi:two-component system nitrate/nitrite response regulator NarL